MSGPSTSKAFDVLRGIVFLLAGLGLTVGTLYSAHGSLAFGRRALMAEGRVIRLNASGSHPEIRFTTKGEQTIEYPQGGMISGYAAGQRVQVLYDPFNPHDVVLNTFGARWGFTIAFFVMGLVFVIAGAGLLWWSMRTTGRTSPLGS